MQGEPPYCAGVLAAVDRGGLEAGTRAVLEWLHSHQGGLLLVLPELREAWVAFGIGG
ncbi:hypothetical protein [Deinococcus sp.]|uniref:hypothetical protein n=1 Tax=Deinococcus sp. TaxID=47478 RepID=UPI003CC6413E